MNEYLLKNRSTKISKTIFEIRAGTFDVKAWKKWEYNDNLCVACEVFEETMDHFMKCEGYVRKTKDNWKNIFENDSPDEEKFQIAVEANERKKLRKKLQEDGRTSSPGSQGSSFC